MADACLPSFDEDDLTRLRSRIYEAIGDLDELPGALMAAARRLGAAHAGVAIPTLDLGLGYFHDAVATDFDMGAAQAFARTSGTLDPWSEGALAKGGVRRGAILIGDQVCSRDAALKSPWQSSVLIPHDCGDPLIAMFAPTNDYQSPVATAVFWRSRRTARFETDAADRLRLFVRDIERMAQVAFKLRAHRKEKALLVSALNAMADAAFVVRADGRVLFANDVAAALTDKAIGLVICNGKLVASSELDQPRFAYAMTRAAQSAEGANLALAQPGAAPLHATIAPASGDAADRLGVGAAAIVIVAQADRSTLDGGTRH